MIKEKWKIYSISKICQRLLIIKCLDCLSIKWKFGKRICGIKLNKALFGPSYKHWIWYYVYKIWISYFWTKKWKINKVLLIILCKNWLSLFLDHHLNKWIKPFFVKIEKAILLKLNEPLKKKIKVFVFKLNNLFFGPSNEKMNTVFC